MPGALDLLKQRLQIIRPHLVAAVHHWDECPAGTLDPASIISGMIWLSLFSVVTFTQDDSQLDIRQQAAHG